MVSGVPLPSEALDSHLAKVLKAKGVDSALVVSRSGLHVAGSPPGQVHLETFVAMSAIILGAAETAAAELEKDLESIELKTGDMMLLLTGLGSRGILVLAVAPEVNSEAVLSSISEEISKMKTILS